MEEKGSTEKVSAKEAYEAPVTLKEAESSIKASGVGSYAVEFTVEKQGIGMEASREITTELMKRIKTKVLNLNPEFIGHVKLFLDNGTETVKQSITIYSEEPQEDIVNSKSGAKPSLKILSAVSKVKKEKLIDIVNSSVREIFEKREIVIQKVEHAHEHDHTHADHEHHGH